MLHPQVGRFYHRKTIFPKGVFTDVLLVAGQNRFCLLKVLTGPLFIVIYHIIIQCESVALHRIVFVREVGIMANVKRHIVVIDRIGY